MANKRVYEVDLKVDGLISNYRKALQVMKGEGATDKTLAPLEKSLNSIAQEFDRLREKGKNGVFSNANEFKKYEQEVEKTYQKLEKLGATFSYIGKDEKKFSNSAKIVEQELKRVKAEAEAARKSLEKSFKALGFDEKQSSTMANGIKSQKELNDAIKEEKKLRQANLREAEKALNLIKPEAYRKAARQLGDRFFTLQSGSAGSLSGKATDSLRKYVAEENAAKDAAAVEKATKGIDKIKEAEKYAKAYETAIEKAQASHISTTDVLQKMNAKLANMVARGRSFQEIWEEIGVLSETYFGGRSPNGTLFGSAETARGAVQRAVDQRDINLGRTEQGKALISAQKSVQQLSDYTRATEGLEQYNEAQRKSKATEEELVKARERDAAVLSRVNSATKDLANNTRKEAEENKNSLNAIHEKIRASDELIDSFEQIKNSALIMFSATSVINLFRRSLRQTYEDVKTLDKSFASIAMVTNYSVKEMWSSYGQYAEMAQELGQKTADVVNASALFYQQGLDTNEALELTTNTMKLATLAGIDYSQATDEMTAAIRGFQMEMDEGSRVTDVYSTLAAHAAASVNDIAQAMVRTSSIANSAGASFENTAAFLTKMIETTQESSENIGDLSEFLNN